ncbi:MAG: hypothetical protein ACOYNN_04180 [Terrimicrobiaceae bacterium]
MKEAIEFTLGTSNSAFNSGLAAAKSSVSKFKGEVTGMVTGLFAGIGIQQLIADFAHVQDLADGFGTTAEAIQRVRGAGELAGTSVDTIAKAMAKLRGDGGKGLEKLGIDAKAFADAGMDQQLLMISEQLDKIEEPQQRINTALEVLGTRGGRELLPMLAQGYDKLKASMDATAVSSNATVQSLADADDKLTAFGNNIKVFFADILGLISKLAQTWGSFWGSAFSTATVYVEQLGGVLEKFFSGDFKGAEAAAKNFGENVGEQIKAGVENIKDIWTPPEDPVIAAKSSAAAAEAQDPAASSGKTTAEKIADLEAEAVRKSLPLYEQIAAIGMQRLDLERAIAAENDPDAKKELEEQLLANTKERLSLEAQSRKDGEAFDQRLADEKENELKAQEADQAKAAAKSLSDAKRMAEEKSKIENEMMMKLFDARQADLGFASGNSGFSGTGQQFAGVNYSAVNAEAEKGLALQEEMKNYLRSIDQKNWTVEIPEAE